MTEITAHHGLLHDTKLHVDDTGGSGRPVVLIHGWPLSGESWAPQIPALTAAGYRVVCYDRRGFGRSDKPKTGYDYDTLAEDLHRVIEGLGLSETTLVGFSMGGGEVARYLRIHGPARIHSVVFASSITPYLMHGDDNPEGPLTRQSALTLQAQLVADDEAFYDQFMTDFFSADGTLKVTEDQRRSAIALARQASKLAVLESMTAWGTTDFREDLPAVSVPALVVHGDADATVPFEGSGKRTHEAIAGSELELIAGAPHGLSVSHAEEFNRALLGFLSR
jgi:non-heme chloroperoxidase